MKYLIKALIFSVVLFFNGSCADNLLGEFADENDDDAILEQAKIYISDGNYTKAIAECSNLSAEALVQANVKYICASAYAGSCGLNMINFLTTISNYNPAVDQLLEYFVQLTGTTTQAQAGSCDTAQNLLQSIGVAADRSDDANLLMVMTNIKKLQAYVEAYADLNSDNIVDAAIDSCNSADYLDDTAVTNIASALWELKESAPNTSLTDLQDIGTAILAYCAALNGVNPVLDFCTAADADTFTADQLRGVRSLISEDADFFGLSDCSGGGGGGLVNCICP